MSAVLKTEALLKLASKKQKESTKVLKAIEQREEEKRNEAKKAYEEYKQRIVDLIAALQPYDGIMLAPLHCYNRNNGYRVGVTSQQIKINSRSYNYGNSNEIEIIGTYNFSISISLDNRHTLKLQRNYFTFNEGKEYLDLPEDKVWTNPVLQLKTVNFYSIKDLIDYIENFIVETVDLDAEKERKQTSAKRELLAKYLNVNLKDIEGEYGTLKVKDKTYKVLSKYDVIPYFSNVIKDNLVKYFDVGLLAEFSGLTVNEIQGLRFAIKDDRKLNRMLTAIVDVKAYSEKLATTYAFDKYVVAYNNVYVVNV